MMKELSTCNNCGMDYSIDINIPDEIWNKIVVAQKPETEIKLCPSCIGYLIHKRSRSENIFGAYKLADLTTLATLPEPGIDLNEVEKLVQLIAMKEANLLEFPNEDKMATDPRGYACKNIADMLRCKIGYTLSHLEAKEGRG